MRGNLNRKLGFDFQPEPILKHMLALKVRKFGLRVNIWAKIQNLQR